MKRSPYNIFGLALQLATPVLQLVSWPRMTPLQTWSHLQSSLYSSRNQTYYVFDKQRMIHAFAPGAHVFAFGSRPHPEISNPGRCIHSQGTANKSQEGGHGFKQLETILIASKNYEASPSHQRVEEHQVELALAPELNDDKVALEPQKAIADEVRCRVAKELTTILDTLEETGEQPFCTATLSCQGVFPSGV